MLYAILAYHDEGIVTSWSPQEDAALMDKLLKIHARHVEAGTLGPAARLDGTAQARTLRGPGPGTVLDGPFAETKEQLLGFYVAEFETPEAGVELARDLRSANPSAIYEIRPIRLYIPGAPLKVET